MLTDIEIFVIEKVKALRVSCRLSQADLADKIGISPSFIGKVESFKYNAKYNLNHINKISKALNISPKDLIPNKPL
jgi:transcriptional regulator with XRE-family HTH domain